MYCKDFIRYKCANFDECDNYVTYNGRGRKPNRCQVCQLNHSKRLRRDAYRKKVKEVVKIAKCAYKMSDGNGCNVSIPYVTNRPIHCPKHARKARLDWMRKYYTGEKVVNCEGCGRHIKYETKKPVLCIVCRTKERINKKRNQMGGSNEKEKR